jgi:hypothetical protein
MNNIDFIKQYGKREFIDMCEFIFMQLSITKAQRKIGDFKVNNSKKYVKFYRKNKDSVNLEFATIYHIGCDKLADYLDNI